ncbi:MAG: ABC transporter permease [Myxococcota bacterium]|jgi:putative ABC transport system permease protein|nr:ABC transporter permease [Myxococcota bacterium]
MSMPAAGPSNARPDIPLRELLGFSGGALRAYPLRSVLSMLGIAIGVMSVVLLTSIGEGTRRYILSEFMQFGTTVIAIHPGKTETGGLPGVLGGTTRKLTIDDSEALARLPNVTSVVPTTMASGPVEYGGRSRSVYIYGATAAMPEVLRFGVARGSFLPPGDPRRGASVTVLGPKLKRELFGDSYALGRFVRIAGTRLRVIGIMEAKGRILGLDIDDGAYVPIATAMQIFNLDEVHEIDVTYEHEYQTDALAEAIRQTLMSRHGDREDFTITTQTAMIETFGSVMRVITLGVGAIAMVSLIVGAVGILTMMWISVGERTGEIGLLRAIGVRNRDVLRIFLVEAAMLTSLGGFAGMVLGLAIAAVLRLAIPGLPVHTPAIYLVGAMAMSVATGLLSGIAPARRAAALEPVEALRAE